MSIRTVLAGATAASSLALLVGCYSTPVMPPTGLLWTGVRAPQSLSVGGQDMGTRRGEASSHAILGLVAWGFGGVAQALLGDPDYVLLDESSNGLDPDGIQEMRELLRHLMRDVGHTVLISSHQLHELSGICNRVGVQSGCA